MKRYASFIIIILALCLLALFNTVSNSMKEKEHPVSTGHNHEGEKKVLDATLEFKNVVVLETTQGNIEIAILKKDIPAASKRVLSLAKNNQFKDVDVKNTEDWYVQFDEVSEILKPLELESANNLTSCRYAVGLAHRKDVNTGTSSIFIIREPSFSVADSYSIFGYVVAGQDVVDKLTGDDEITASSVRKKTGDDDKALVAIMKQSTDDQGLYTRFQMAAHAEEAAHMSEQISNGLPGDLME